MGEKISSRPTFSWWLLINNSLFMSLAGKGSEPWCQNCLAPEEK